MYSTLMIFLAAALIIASVIWQKIQHSQLTDQDAKKLKDTLGRLPRVYFSFFLLSVFVGFCIANAIGGHWVIFTVSPMVVVSCVFAILRIFTFERRLHVNSDLKRKLHHPQKLVCFATLLVILSMLIRSRGA